MEMDRTDPVNGALPVSLRLEMEGAGASAANEGFWGIPVRPETTYTASFYAKGGNGYAGPVTAAIMLDDGQKIVASGKTEAVGGKWQKYTVTLKTGADVPTTAKAKFCVGGSGAGTLWFSNVSLFPPTYQDHAKGLRPDLMKMLADLHPAFIRLPGGNYLEGNTFPTRFDWKKMIGPVDDRPGHMGCWNYRSSDGFGMPEYLLWCKQLNAEPVLAVFAGYTLNHNHVNAGPELQKYVGFSCWRRVSTCRGMRARSGGSSGRRMGFRSRSRCTMWRWGMRTGLIGAGVMTGVSSSFLMRSGGSIRS